MALSTPTATWIDDPPYTVEPEMWVQFEATVATLRKAGAQVDENARPAINLSNALSTYMPNRNGQGQKKSSLGMNKVGTA